MGYSDGKKIISIFIGVIMAVVLISVIANSIYSSSTTVTYANKSFTAGAINVSTVLTGIRELPGAYTIYNSTGTLVSAGGNVTLQEQVVNGALAVTMRVNQNGTGYNGTVLNVSGTFYPTGYVSNSGGRGILALTTIMGALAIAIFVIAGLMNKGPLAKLIQDRMKR